MDNHFTPVCYRCKLRPMKLVILTPKQEFSNEQQSRLAKIGQVCYTDSRREYPMAELLQLCQGADILAFDPDNIGGFEVAHDRLIQLLDKCPTLLNIALSTTSFGYIDQAYCHKKGIGVTNVPHYSSESVAEHTIALLLGCAKRIFLSDHATRKGEYQLVKGQEVVGKTLGIIGLGSIGTRTATLAQRLGMKVVAYNRTKRKVKGVELHDLNYVLRHADFLSLHLIDSEETAGFLSPERLSLLKPGVIVVNTAGRELVNEQAMAKALKSGLVDSYALEVGDLKSGPLPQCNNAFLFKGFGWYTKEALERNKEIWVNNIVGLSHGKPINSLC